MIHDVKDDPILQVPGQEPSTYTSYRHKLWGVLDTLLITLCAKFQIPCIVGHVKDHLSLKTILGRTLIVPDEVLGG